MHEKAARRDRPALPLRQRHPIGFRQRLDVERAERSVAAGPSDQQQQSIAGRQLGVMGEDLEPAMSAIEQPDRDRFRFDRLFERADDVLGLRRIRLDAGLMHHRPEDFACRSRLSTSSSRSHRRSRCARASSGAIAENLSIRVGADQPVGAQPLERVLGIEIDADAAALREETRDHES